MARIEPGQFAVDFALGGGLVAGAVALASLFSGVVAGIVAALPARLAVSLGFLQLRTPDAMERAVEGMVLGAFGYLAFVALFALLWNRAGFWPALGAATAGSMLVPTLLTLAR